MKYRTTNKELRTYAPNLISISYCGAQNLLQYENPTAYACGVYGWNYDVYNVGNFTISTGYRPIGKSVNYDLLNAYESKARAINGDYKKPYDDRKKEVTALLYDFLTRCTA